VQQEVYAEVQKGLWQANVCGLLMVKVTGCIWVLGTLNEVCDSLAEGLSF